jgi:hypothetical protein
MDPRNAVTELIYTYAERIDAGDFSGVGELLGDALLTFEGYDATVSGVDAIAALYGSTTRRFEDGTPKTKHLMTNVMVHVDHDELHASSKSYYTVLHAVPGSFALAPVISGRYRDTFACVDGTWRFESMHVIVDLIGDLSSHLTQEI